MKEQLDDKKAAGLNRAYRTTTLLCPQPDPAAAQTVRKAYNHVLPTPKGRQQTPKKVMNVDYHMGVLMIRRNADSMILHNYKYSYATNFVKFVNSAKLPKLRLFHTDILIDNRPQFTKISICEPGKI